MVERVGKRLLVWGSDMEEATLEQASRSARLPFIEGRIALMPDAHRGKGATVGSVIPTRGAVIPAAVGVDIGCGMIAVETTATAGQLPDDLNPLMPLIEERVPAGVGRGHDHRNVAGEAWLQAHPSETELSDKRRQTVVAQFGSLGSGNHFVEVCLDERDRVWVVLHSGSRGIGNQLATQHIQTAKRLAEMWFIPLEDPDLAYLVQGTPEFDAYIADMHWAQDYALANREQMMDETLRSLRELVPFEEARRINCHHNFTQMEHHHNRDLWITRKGAIKAGRDDLGVIPGSMGSRTYIVRGRGNPASFASSSHGAGRRLSRTQARKEFTGADLTTAMGDRAWNADRAADLVDEHPGAYKDIDEVMAAQQDLVEVLHTLHQVFNYKG
jgi:tRNA-splicing ligase RtcB (3'-phosphate/5'-hydroxy nucleic acid ligase)